MQQEHHPTDEPAGSAKDASPRRPAEIDNTSIASGWKTSPKHSKVLYSTPPTQSDEKDFYASIGRRAGLTTAGGSKRDPVASSSEQTRAFARSTLRHRSDEVQSPSNAANEYEKPVKRHGEMSPAGLSEEEAFYASMGQRAKAPPVASKAESRRSDSSLPKPVVEHKLSELLRASSSSLADSPMKDARDEIRALRHGHNTNTASGTSKRTFDARNNNLLKRKASTLDATGEDPVVEWVMATGAPKMLCSCEGGPAGVYQDYIICRRCKTL